MCDQSVNNCGEKKKKTGLLTGTAKNADSIELHMVEDLNEAICLAKSVLSPDPSRSQML